jgi:short-subunit dehydrogenase involved in D-alanine esterification of teichoic acids
MEDLVAIVMIFGGGTLFALSMSPVGRALADRIRGTSNNGAIGDKDLEELREAQMAILDEVELLRQEVVDVNERVDFAERLLAKHNDVGALPGAGERGD